MDRLRNHLVGFLVCAVMTCMCQAKRTDVERLKIKVNKLSRKHNALQGEVDEMWAIIVTTGLGNGNKTPTEDLGTANQSIDIHELKNEVQSLAVSSRIAFKNEKSWQRKLIRNLTKVWEEFHTRVTEKSKRMKRHLEKMKLDVEVLDKSCKDAQITMESNISVFDERYNNTLHSVRAELASVEMENQELKRSFLDMQKDYKKMKSDFEAENQHLKTTISQMQTDFESLKAALNRTQSTAFATDKSPPLQPTPSAAVTKTATTAAITTTTTTRPNRCETVWRSFNGHCYLFVRQIKTRSKALAHCVARNSYLLEITTDEEYDFVYAEFVRLNINKITYLWTGGSDSGPEGTFVFQHSGEPVPDRFWKQGEPDNYHGDEHCVKIFYYSPRYFRLEDTSCGGRYWFICEKS